MAGRTTIVAMTETILFPGAMPIPYLLQDRLRHELPKTGIERRLCQYDSEVWVTDDPIALHSDSTAEGMVVFGLVLVNDPRYLLVSGGKAYDLPVGSLYRLDGREPHGALEYKTPVGCFAFLAWDMPPTYTMNQFYTEARAAIREKAK